MYALDYGADQKLRLHGSGGPIEVPKIPRGLTPAQQFAETLRILLDGEDDLFGGFPGDNIVTESPTVGSSGAEPELIRDIVNNSEHNILLISSRAVKNFKRRHGTCTEDGKWQFNIPELDSIENDDALSAAIIYRLAAENSDRLKEWRYVSDDEKYHRKYATVRPHDKRNYSGSEPDRWMSLLPQFWTLPPDMQEVFGDGKGSYCRSRTMPFAQALEEPIASTRDGYEKVIGLYGNGYPSHYRRATENLRQYIAKKCTGVKKIDELSEKQHKESRRINRWYIRRLYHLAQGITDPEKGKCYPVPKGRLDRLQGIQNPEEGKSHPVLF